MSDIFRTDPQPDTAIMLQDVAVRYRIPSQTIHTFKEYVIQLVQGRIKHTPFWALKNINLEVKQGEIFGILGRNGAGKSTLLKVVSKVLIPTKGRVWIKGFISPLLQLGAGFHPELTGRENIYLNATLLGHPQNEIDEKIDEIIDFSEIKKFLDAPLRTYSSGMNARLGFAVATAWQPDILILDEVLSVGDVAFQAKCIRRMKKYQEDGATVLMVSHSIENVRENCQRAMWLDQGEIQVIGDADQVCNAYQQVMAV
jgi:ABC-2 type transport system ATP-binding protein